MAYLTHHLVSVAGFLLAAALLARVLGERRAHGSTIAWLLAIALVPWLGVPCYFVFGGRKVARVRRQKPPLLPARPVQAPGTMALLPAGEDAFRAMGRLIDEASRSIHVATFILGDDEVGRALVDRLIQQARRGLEVRLLLDGLYARRAPAARLAALRAAGGRVATFLPILGTSFRGHANLRNHRKIAVADGGVAIVGGMNLAAEYMGPSPDARRWRDLSAVVTGPVVGDIDRVFAADWAFATGEQLAPAPAPPAGAQGAPSTPIRVIASGPDTEADVFYDEVLSAFFAARERIWMVTPYFIPDESLAHALTLAARRGVDVRLIIPARSNHLLADLAGADLVRRVHDAGGRVLRFGGMIHAKVCVIDAGVALLGSANLDMRSLFLDYEIALEIEHPGSVEELAAWFRAQASAASEGLAPPSRGRRFAENLGRLLAPLV